MLSFDPALLQVRQQLLELQQLRESLTKQSQVRRNAPREGGGVKGDDPQRGDKGRHVCLRHQACKFDAHTAACLIVIRGCEPGTCYIFTLVSHSQELADLKKAYAGGKVMVENSVQQSQVWG